MKTIFTLIATLGLLTSLGASAQTLPDKMYMGTSIPVKAGLRNIVIDANTKNVNVKEGEEVEFTAGQTTFAWRFDGPESRTFNLQDAAPPGALANPVKVYVQRKPTPR